MSLELRDYQERIIVETRVALREHNSVCVQLPTGGGKTALSTKMLANVHAKGRHGFFMVHRQELVDQTMRTFAEFGLPYGVISAGYTEAPFEPIQIASVDTLRARLAKGWRPRVRPSVMVIDECHHAAAGGWSYVLNEFADAKKIGLTATPRRLDGQGLRTHFSHMVKGPSTAELIRRGYLSSYRPFIPSSPDLSSVKSRMGDYVKDQMAGAMDKPSITGDAISHYLQHARGRRALAFCVSVEHSQHVVAQFKEAGIVAWHLDGGTNRGERRAAITAFRRGEIKVLSNVDLFGEGFDVPAADVSIMLRPTRSLSLYLQQCGRVLRPLEGKAPAILLDHAGNIMRHGLPCDERDWSLDGESEGEKQEKAEAGPKQCPKCLFAHRAGPPHCPNCGFKYEKMSRQVDQVEGALREVTDIAAIRAEKAAAHKAMMAKRKDEQLNIVKDVALAARMNDAALLAKAKAKALADLVELGKARGYRDPVGWAAHYWSAGIGRRGSERNA